MAESLLGDNKMTNGITRIPRSIADILISIVDWSMANTMAFITRILLA